MNVADLFWDVATSGVVLIAIGSIAASAFIVAHLPAVAARFWPTVGVYAKAAMLVQVIAASLLFFLVGFRVSDERAETRQLKNDLAFQELQLDTAKATAADAEALKAEAEAKADEAKGLLNDFRKKFGSGDAGCDWTDDEFGGLLHLRPAKRR